MSCGEKLWNPKLYDFSFWMTHFVEFITRFMSLYGFYLAGFSKWQNCKCKWNSEELNFLMYLFDFSALTSCDTIIRYTYFRLLQHFMITVRLFLLENAHMARFTIFFPAMWFKQFVYIVSICILVLRVPSSFQCHLF